MEKQTFIDKLKIITNEEAIKIADKLDTQRNRLIFILLRFTGLRLKEILDLKITDIPIYSNINTDTCQIKSENWNRYNFIPENILIELDRYIIEQRCRIDNKCNILNDYLFVSEGKDTYGEQLTIKEYTNIFIKACKGSDNDFSIKDIKYTYTISLYLLGMPVDLLRGVLGHSNIRTTLKYIEHYENTIKVS